MSNPLQFGRAAGARRGRQGRSTTLPSVPLSTRRWASAASASGSVCTAKYDSVTPSAADSDRASWNLDPNLLEDVLRERAARRRVPRALVVVHLYGQTADMDPILEVCRRYDVAVLEDAAEDYVAHLLSTVEGSLAGLTLVVDCAHGAAAATAPGSAPVSARASRAAAAATTSSRSASGRP